MDIVGKTVTGVGLSVVNFLVGGYVAAMLWLWFVVPVTQARPVTIAEAAGLVLVASVIRGARYDKEKKSGFAVMVESSVYMLIFWALALGAGWLVSLAVRAGW